MLGRLLKAIAGCVVGAIMNVALYNGVAQLKPNIYGSVTGADVVSTLLSFVLYIVFRGQEVIGTIFAVSVGFNISVMIMKIVTPYLVATT